MKSLFITMTKAQEDLMQVVSTRWTNQLYSLPSLNEDECRKGVEWLYKFSGLEKPKVYFCQSILEAQVLVNVLKSENNNVMANVIANVMANVIANVMANVRANVGANVRANVMDNVWANVGDNVGANVGANVMANVGANVGANVRANVSNNVMANVWANVRANVGDNVMANVGDNVSNNVGANVELLCSYGDVSDYGWVSFYDYFTEIGILENSSFNNFRDLLKSGYFTMIQMRNACFVVRNPKFINLENNQMHSLKGNAIEFNDGWGMNFIQGRYLPPNTFNKLVSKEYTFEDFLKEDNEEFKSTVLLYIQLVEGDNGLFNFLSQNMKEIDTYVDKKNEEFLINTKGMNVGVYNLFKGSIGAIELSAVRCYCPSTDRMFFLFCENQYTNAKDAIASLCRIPKKMQGHLLYLQRQGERFSAVWSEEGKLIRKNMTQDDLQDTVALSGDEYFEKMRFEY